MAYDARKAYEGQREILQPPAHHEEIGIRYGVQILWPVLLLQQRMLRLSLAFLDHSAKTQAITYALEAVIEDGLQEDFAAQGTEAIALWQRLDPAQPDVFDKLDSRGAIFCSWTKAERKRYFLKLLSSLDPLYETLYKYQSNDSEKNLLSPDAFRPWEDAEWPDPKW